MLKKDSKIFYFLVILVLAAGIFLRFWKLDSIPPGIQYDEAYNGLDAIHANETGDYRLFYPENTGREGLHINVIAIFIKLFGVSSLSLRLANAMWGSLTLIGFYFLLRELKLSRLSVLLGVFMLAFSFWHLDFSRTAFRAIMVPLCLIWALYFFLRGLNSKKVFWSFLLAGLFLGLGFYSYIAFRIAPLIFIIFGCAYLFFEKKGFLKNWKIITIFMTASIICALPILIYFSTHFGDFWARSQAVSVFNSAKLTTGQALFTSLGVHLQAFFVHGDNNPRHNYNNQPLIPAGWVAFFVIGFIISLKEIGENIWGKIKFRKIAEVEKSFKFSGLFYPSILAQSIFWVMLVPGILSIEGIPHSLRIIGTIPGVFLFCVFPLEYILKIYRKMRDSTDIALRTRGTNLTLTFMLGLVAVIVVSGFLQMYVYFGLWASDLRTAGGFERKIYLMGMLIKDLDVHRNNYVITAYNTAIYQNSKTSSLKTTEYIAYPKIKNYLFSRPLDGLNNINCDDVQIVFQESDQWLRDQYRGKCPNLITDKYTFNDSKYVFYVMSVR
ncbi:MAG: glycosyltransferase family 39 protein [Candidatus Moranbacteria bacterium]|nr:glycosyltransferase family 39 protein [Candidatus Moranbacteria bacterium]